MPQDRESGAEANRFGRECGERMIAVLGGKKVKAGSNEFTLNGKLLSIHCARPRTTRVGVTRLALERIDAVLGAFQQADGSFQILQLPADQFSKYSTPTRSRGPAADRVLLAPRSVFEQYGQLIKVIHD